MLAKHLLPLIAVLLCACASSESRVDYDPLEPLNRAVYKFNDVLDRAILKPVAKGYKFVVPSVMRKGVTNFSFNLRTPRSAINNFLQGKPRRGFDDIARFLVNSTFGIGGLIDIASARGFEQYDEDFGQTFAVWGVPQGPYVVLPLLGPRTMRHAVAVPFNYASDPLFYYENASVRDKLWVLRTINLRSRLLKAEELIGESKDRYITIRESYLQNRNYDIHDGDPPEDDDFYDDFCDEDSEDEGDDCD
ncbi:MAG: VacJ family lipoprotein [Gammaproteobacteria bacterium]|nr:VacJ family lipoprotein [Gammaproteobacteria bacterium]